MQKLLMQPLNLKQQSCKIKDFAHYFLMYVSLHSNQIHLAQRSLQFRDLETANTHY